VTVVVAAPRRSPASRTWVPAAALGLIVLASLVLRTGGLTAGYWTDEGISVGIASHPLSDIPGLLRQDGSPPLYYALLHGWMALFGQSEAATRSLSLVFALLAIPVAWWAGRALFGERAAWLAAGAMAIVPYLNEYAQETRMYSLVVVEALVATTAFVLAYGHGRREHLVTLGVALTLLLYTHNWAFFLAGGLALAWLGLRRRRLIAPRDSLILVAAVALACVPWLPSLIFQIEHTGAPWTRSPNALRLGQAPAAVFGPFAVPLLVALVVFARRRDAGVLLTVAGAASALAWAVSQVEPAWTPRYLAIVVGPAVVALAGLAERGGRIVVAGVVVVALLWSLDTPPTVKSNARAVARVVAPSLGHGGMVLASAPEDVPVLARYLPRHTAYVSTAGPVPDPNVTDWRDLMRRLRRAQPSVLVDRLVRGMRPGSRLVLVVHQFTAQAPLENLLTRRGAELTAAVARDERLQRVPLARARDGGASSRVRATAYVRVGGDGS
jgi:hypothetical protein